MSAADAFTWNAVFISIKLALAALFQVETGLRATRHLPTSGFTAAGEVLSGTLAGRGGIPMCRDISTAC